MLFQYFPTKHSCCCGNYNYPNIYLFIDCVRITKLLLYMCVVTNLSFVCGGGAINEMVREPTLQKLNVNSFKTLIFDQSCIDIAFQTLNFTVHTI